MSSSASKRAARVWFWLTLQLERNSGFRKEFADLEWSWAIAEAKRLGDSSRGGSDN